MTEDRFEAERARMLGMGYRMLGTLADAEDVVQEVWLRWQATENATIDNPEAWLTTVTTRVALDRLRSTRRRQARETYIGPWLPEPIVFDVSGPERAAEIADSLTLGFLVLMDRLNPIERAVFLLADVFAVPYRDVAATVGRSEAACRQLASRARRRIHTTSTRRPRDDERNTVNSLVGALAAGDIDAVLACLAPGVVLLFDGGASRKAARRPVVGADRVARFMTNLTNRHMAERNVADVLVNGDPGVVVRTGEAIDFVVAFEVEGVQIQAVWIISNPEKLAHVNARATIR